MFIMSLPNTSTTWNNKHEYGAQNNTGGAGETFVQFVTGHVNDVVTNVNHYLYKQFNNPKYLNSIKANINHGDESSVFSKSGQQSPTTDNLTADIYFPLFRGIADVPMKGDQVLLCQFGGVKYYMGPLNTNNNPNINPDWEFVQKQQNAGKNSNRKKLNDQLDLNPLFAPQFDNVPRLQKPVLSTLDSYVNTSSDTEIDLASYGIGDMIFEGRFGNSIRLGSRGGFPHMFFSNGRWHVDKRETLQDDTLISITSFGKISDHFFSKFELSSNLESNKNRKLKFEDTDGAQILLRSNKIIFDSRQEDITLSSASNINIGSNKNLNIFTNLSTLIESKNIYLGKRAFDNKGKGDRQALVMGNDLVDLMKEMIDAIGLLYVPGVIFSVSGPINAGGSPGWAQLQALKSRLTTALSQHHYVENNTTGGKK